MKINLLRAFFTDRQYVLLENRHMKAVCFRYSTGVEAIRVENKKGYFIILPFQGQQVWRACFLGNELTMKTMFHEPEPTQEFLKTYGGFLLHCGVGAIGTPQEDDNHPEHGELPNAEYRDAYIECGEDYIAVGGKLEYNLSFTRNYTFSPECRLYEDDTVLKVKIRLLNRRMSPMEYMYLCHINFCPIDGARLMYSANYDSDHIKVHKVIGEEVPNQQKQELLAYMDRLEQNPKEHHIIGAPGQIYDPEICFTIKYKGDVNSRGYTIQNTGNGSCYVSHPVDLLPYGIRWISRTNDEDSCGMVLPATAEHFGYQTAKRKGQLKYLEGGQSVEYFIEVGWLDKQRTDELIELKELS